MNLSDVDDDDDEDMCTLVVSLMQKHRRLLKRHGGANLTIGYEIYQVISGTEVQTSSQCGRNIKYWDPYITIRVQIHQTKYQCSVNAAMTMMIQVPLKQWSHLSMGSQASAQG